MTTAQYNAWVNSGRSYQLAYPVVDLAATLRRHGYEVGTIGDYSHMTASTPEDHTPYSATGWPFPSPRGWVFALDIMPGGAVGLGRLGAQLVADRSTNVAGASAIKYMNWTPDGQACRHDSWEPGHGTSGSSDVGHIHISMRSDFQTSHAMAGYDPVVRALGGATPAKAPESGQSAGSPQWPGRVLIYRAGAPMMQGTDVKQAQQRLHDRGWSITVDGWYGVESASIVTRFQQDSSAHGWALTVDGQLGAHTWDALWRRPVS